MHNCKERARRRPQKGKSQEDSLCVVAGHHHSVSNANATEAAATRCKVQEGEEQAQEYINPFIGLTLFVINIIIIFILNECNESLCRVSFWWWTRWRGSSGELLGIDQSDHIPQHCVPSTLHWLRPPLPFDFIVKNGLNGEADKSDLHIFDFSVLIRE